MKLDALDKAILDRLQAEFPLTQRPYRALGRGPLNFSEAAYLDRLQALSAAGVIREIGAVFDLHRLGYPEHPLRGPGRCGPSVRRSPNTINDPARGHPQLLAQSPPTTSGLPSSPPITRP